MLAPTIVEDIVDQRKIITNTNSLPLTFTDELVACNNSIEEFFKPMSITPNVTRSNKRYKDVTSSVKKMINNKSILTGVLATPINTRPNTSCEFRSRSTSPDPTAVNNNSALSESTTALTKTIVHNKDNEVVDKATSSKPKLLHDLENFMNIELLELQKEYVTILFLINISDSTMSTNQEFDLSRLQVFRECFRMFADQFKLYEPVLNRIRKEYENAIEYFVNRGDELEDIRIKMKEMTNENHSKINSNVQKYAKEVQRLTLTEELTKIEKAKKILDVAHEQQTTKVQELEEVVEVLHKQKDRLALTLKSYDESSATSTSIVWENDLEVIAQQEETIRKNEKLTVRVKDLEQQLKKATDLLLDYEGTEKPTPLVRLKSVTERLRIRNQEYSKLKSMYVMLNGRYSTSEKKLIKAEEQVEKLTLRLSPFLSSDEQLTPRPHWDSIIPFEHREEILVHAGETTRDRSTSLATQLFHHKSQNQKLQIELNDCKKFIGLKHDETIYSILEKSNHHHDDDDDNHSNSDDDDDDDDEEFAKEDWFLGMGADDKVLPYLRFVGKIKNLDLTKRQTELTIKEYWDAKVNHENELGGGIRVDPIDFYLKFLKDKASVHCKDPADLPRLLVEWGYSMRYSLQRWIQDPDCDAFYNIVYNYMDQEVYYTQTQMINRLIQSVQSHRQQITQDQFTMQTQNAQRKKTRREELDYDVDMSSGEENDLDEEFIATTVHNKKPRRRLQTLGESEIPKELMIQIMRDMFPVKTPEYLHKLIITLNKDFPGDVIDFEKLFEEDEDYNQSDFVEELRRQQMVEREQYLTELSNNLIDKDSNNDGSVTVQEIHAALNCVDPGIPIVELDKMISKAMNVDVEDLMPDVDAKGERIYKGRLLIFIPTLMNRLRMSQVQRFARKPNGKGHKH
ncbi:translin-associated factor X-interacting protein [Acrasis kona]|uniref:Translin-associated factor X-interacting protein n=1 Tax=Acrasis kona TaxID=1008807 RepID=A0AAW2ZBF4_9EUKA